MGAHQMGAEKKPDQEKIPSVTNSIRNKIDNEKVAMEQVKPFIITIAFCLISDGISIFLFFFRPHA